MATLTAPMTLLLCGGRRAHRSLRWCWSGGARWIGGLRLRGLRGLARRRGAAPFGVDEFGQPADLPVHRLQAVALQLDRVAVEPVAGAGQRGTQALALALDGAPAALEDAQPGVGRGVPEERQADAEEAAVVVGLRTGLADQLVEALLALRGDPVDDLAATTGERRRLGGQLRLGVVGGDVSGR